ncbi:MAG: cyclic nucleotide-binding domain-containing protein [Deltaproteobacteria bacterium]|nr:cyclic nucleotide-binding domain-containing protein [Deltaproteobacteria bacterium]
MTDEGGKIARIINEAYLFKSLEEGAKEKLTDIALRRVYGKDMPLITEGELGGDMFIIESGSVEVSATLPGGDTKLAELGAGAVLGEVAAITDAPRTSTVVALETVVAIVFPQDAIKGIAQAYPKFRSLLEKMIEGRAQHTITLIPPPSAE